MKKLMLGLIGLMTVAFAAGAQSHYVIDGKVTNVKDGTVINFSVSYGIASLSGQTSKCTVKDGRFHYEDTLKSGLTDVLTFNVEGGSSMMSQNIFVTKGAKVQISGDGAEHALWNVKSNVPAQKTQQAIFELEKDYLAARLRLKPQTTKQNEDSIRTVLHGIAAKSMLKVFDYLLKRKSLDDAAMMAVNPDNFKYYFSNDSSYKPYCKSLYEKMTPLQKKSAAGMKLSSLLGNVKPVSEGDMMVDGDIYDVDGKVHRLSEFKGKWTLLDFWSYGCGPCHAAMPEIKELAADEHLNANVLSISIDHKYLWNMATKDFGLDPAHNFNDGFDGAGIYAHYNQGGIPCFVLLNPEGRVDYITKGYMQGMLKSLLRTRAREKKVVDKEQLHAPMVVDEPEVEYNTWWMQVHKVELTDTATIVTVNLKKRSVVSDTYFLKERNSGKEYYFLGVDGIGLDEATNARNTTCRLFFEPLEKESEVFGVIADETYAAANCYGIHLKPKQQKDEEFKKYDGNYYMNQPYTADTTWRWSNRHFLHPGKAKLIVHMGGFAQELRGEVESCDIMVKDEIKNITENFVGTFDENGRCEIDVELPYAQFVQSRTIGGEIYLAPNDTLELFTTMETNAVGNPLYFTMKGNSNAARLTMVTDHFVNKYGRKELKDSQAYKWLTQEVAKGREAALKLAERYAAQVVEIIEDSELRKALVESPLSNYEKDVIMTSVVGSKLSELGDVDMEYGFNKYTNERQPDGTLRTVENETFEPLGTSCYDCLMKYKDELFNNPLMLGTVNSALVNRLVYCSLFDKADHRLTNVVRNQDGVIVGYDGRRVDETFEHTLIMDVCNSQSIVGTISHEMGRMATGETGGNVEFSKDLMEFKVGEALTHICSPIVARGVLSKYREFVKATEGEAKSLEQTWTAEQKELWQKVTGQYAGNVLYVDFWSMGCAPCRELMKRSRDDVEALKGKAVKYLYVTEEAELVQAEQWMKENRIGGEHIYLTRKEMAMLRAMFKVSAIPHVAVIGKDGKVLIEHDYGHIGAETLLRLAER